MHGVPKEIFTSKIESHTLLNYDNCTGLLISEASCVTLFVSIFYLFFFSIYFLPVGEQILIGFHT